MAQRKRTPLRPERVEPQVCTLSRRLEVLRQTPFFSNLPESDIARIGSFFRDKAFTAGQTVYFAGEPAGKLYVVATGKVKLARTAPAGRTVALGIFGPGEFFGSVSALGDQRYPDTAVAHTGCCLLSVAAPDFRTILRLYPQVATAALDIVAARLRAMHELVEQLSIHSVEQRIASTLLGLAAKLGEKRGNALLIQMPLSRQDLADMAGAVPETISRIMTRWRQSGLVRTGRQWVAILDPERLAVEAGAGTKTRP